MSDPAPTPTADQPVMPALAMMQQVKRVTDHIERYEDQETFTIAKWQLDLLDEIANQQCDDLAARVAVLNPNPMPSIPIGYNLIQAAHGFSRAEAGNQIAVVEFRAFTDDARAAIAAGAPDEVINKIMEMQPNGLKTPMSFADPAAIQWLIDLLIGVKHEWVGAMYARTQAGATDPEWAAAPRQVHLQTYVTASLDDEASNHRDPMFLPEAQALIAKGATVKSLRAGGWDHFADYVMAQLAAEEEQVEEPA